MSSVRTVILSVCIALLGLVTSADAATAEQIGSPTITLPSGANLTGITRLYNESDFLNLTKPIDSYLGIPFAVPPVGDLRFEDPQPYTIMEDYNATEHRAICPQMSPVRNVPVVGPVVGRDVSEDCLYLTIYSPSPKPTTPVPVMVWIHGGGYAVGAGSGIIYQPIPLVAMSDIIVVNLNYRLGVFGFLTTGDDVVTGNQGMMDQVLGLKWVRDNIAAFGGDPARVTIAGESAGGGSVSLHMLSPLSTGLFQQAIMQSGNAICPWAWSTNEGATAAHRELAVQVGCDQTDSSAMVECLRHVDMDTLIREQILMGNGALSAPVVDGDFLPYNPVDMARRGQFQMVPTLIGTNEDEMSSAAMAVFPGSILDDQPPVMNISLFRSLIPGMVYYTHTTIEVSAVEQHYVDWTVADDPSADQLDGYIRLGTDQTFSCPTEFFARAIEANGTEIYRYEMTHDPNWSVYAGIPKWLGATHAEDLQYVFAWALNPWLESLVNQTNDEKFMSIEFMRYWSNFVKSGNPNEPVENQAYTDWPQYTMPGQDYKKLSLDMDNDRAMRASSCAFWLRYMPGLHTEAAPIEDVYEQWQEDYANWRDIDMPSWSTEFEEYKANNPTCPTAMP
ncbi:acetylcholinesterase-like [Diadema antillarum]|uniref:acetylcholinesterase-like n=1 Tax=Diadema antillarum TaxID=105358 RepID=UPI003A8ACAF3